jgi:tRNA (guanine37-N1)-methyltransferase
MKIIIATLFPEMFVGPFDHSIIKRAQEKGSVSIDFVQIRDFALDNHKSVDDRPFGGGQGMVMKVDVVDRALQHCREMCMKANLTPYTILLDPRGTPFVQATAKDLASKDCLVLLCGHYEGVDERIRSLVDTTISIGDYVVTGGELPAMMISDAVVRLLPQVLKPELATQDESFTTNLLEYPQYTRPPEYKGMKVPPILLSGNHKDIQKWKQDAAQKITNINRPDLSS